MEERGRGLERAVVDAFRFFPRAGRTYMLLLLKPRRYFESLESPHLVRATSPAAFWLTNVVLVKTLRSCAKGSDSALLAEGTSGVLGLCLGTALFALYMVASLDLRGWSSFRRMLRVVFSGALLFVPAYAVGAWVGPISIDMLERLKSAVLLGTPGEVSWHEWAEVLLLAAVFVAWFLLVGFGSRVVFRKSRTSIAIVLSASVAFVIVGFLVWLGIQMAVGIREYVQVPARRWGEARAALVQTPPDYLAAQRAFDALDSARPPVISRDTRLVAKIGKASAGRAVTAVALKKPEVERRLNESLMRLLSGQTAEAAVLLEQASREFSDDASASTIFGADRAKDIDEIKRMLADESYNPRGVQKLIGAARKGYGPVRR